MRELIEAVARQLRAMGITNVRVSYSDLYVGEASWWFSMRRGKTVRIDGETFRGGRNQVAEIVNHIFKTLSDRLKELAERKEREERRKEASKIGALLQGTGLDISADHSKDELILTFRHPDKGTIMAAADFLQDNGFAQRSLDRASVADEEQFTARHMQRLFDMLTSEEKVKFLVGVGSAWRDLAEEKEQEEERT